MTKIIVALLLFASFAVAQETQTPNWDNVRAVLEEMMKADQSQRQLVDSVEAAYGWDSKQAQQLWAEQATADSLNQARLRELVKLYGWPGKSQVGETGSDAAFLVVQHAPYEMQQEFFPMMQDAADKGELSKASLALLQDRMLTHEGKPQIYGSQLKSDPETGELEFYQIADEANVNTRRASVGLEPIEDYAKRFGIVYKPGNTTTH